MQLGNQEVEPFIEEIEAMEDEAMGKKKLSLYDELLLRGREEGREEGRDLGEREQALKTAKILHEMKMPIEAIARATGLTLGELEKILK